jgi:tetratricopeptide (TPR) repeat protein
MAVVAKKTQVIRQDTRVRHFQTLRRRQVAVVCLVAAGFFAGASCGHAERLDELSLDRWQELREVERYQLNIAEKYYREKNWKVGLAEYEKFLTLYERSVGAPYVQLKWSLCQIHLRKQNTAIKEGFQSVIDYWPDAPQAIAAAYFIGHAYKEMGEVRKAKKAYQSVLNNHPKHLAAVLTAVDLVDLTMIDGDIETRVALWKQLTFEMPRTRESKYHCQKASGYLAAHTFEFAAFDDAVKSLATTYTEQQLPAHVASVVHAPITHLVADDKRRAQGHQLADRAAAWLRSHVPAIGTTDAEKQAARQHWYFLADVQAASKRADKVTATYEQIVSTFGADDETLGRFANWYKSTSKYDEARRQYARYKDKIEGQNQIAYSFRQQGNYDAAVVAYQSNVARDVENPARWHAEIASTYRTARKYPEAILVYQQLLKTDVKDAEKWLWALGTTFRDSGKHKEAIGHFRQCNNFPSNYSEMAACHRALKDYKEAIILYGQIVGGAPQSAPWAMLQIGYTQEQAGKKELAIRAFQHVCKSYPKASYASQAHAHLQDKYKISVTLGGGTNK